MISVVVCSINAEFAARLQKNITNTIGVPFEVIILDNTVEKQSINYIYNLGASKARFDTICFLHEDVLIHTSGWGSRLLDIFAQEEKIGLIGIAGSKYKSRTNSGWYTRIKEFDCCRINHLDPSGKETKVYLNPEPGSGEQEVVVIDGVFLCTKKSVWNEFRFDDQLLQGFHFYDIDFSFRVSQKYTSVVTYDIELTHFTLGGNFGNNWIYHSRLWHDKYAADLPFSCVELSEAAVQKNELMVARTWLSLLMKQRVSFANRLEWLLTLTMHKAIRMPLDVFKFFVYDLYKKIPVPKSRSNSTT